MNNYLKEYNNKNKNNLQESINTNNNNKNNSQMNTSMFKDMTIYSWGILVAMFFKTFALLPTVIKIAKVKTAEDISIVTPVFLLIAFTILFIICIKKKFHLPLLLFLVGIVVSVILLIQKIIYESSKSNDENNYNDKYLDKLDKYNKKVHHYDKKLFKQKNVPTYSE